ncbi:MAG: tetratricopeptide repeat protein, partial [Nitrospiraceae bacterium]
AKAILEEAVKLSPENLRAHRTLAKIYVAQGAKDAALRSCNVILAANPQDQEALSLRTILGEPVAQPSSAQTKPLPKKQSGKQMAESADQTGGAGRSRQLDPDTQQAAAVISELPKENSAAVPIAGEASASVPKRAVAVQLTQLLASVQARRRDRDRPTEPKTPTS